MRKRLFAILLCAAMLIGLTSGCTSGKPTEKTPPPDSSSKPDSQGKYKDGVFTGSGAGMESRIEVKVTVDGGKITNIEIVSHNETAGISDPAFKEIPEKIIKAQSTEVDAVSGATATSKGIIEAVSNALSGEGGDASAGKLTIEPDVIVVGAGMAGLCATVRSVELGMKVLLVEQSVRIGGASNFSGGTISGADFKIQRENGITDSPEMYYEDIVKLGGEGNFNPELAKSQCERSGEAIDWLDMDLHVDFADRGIVTGGYTAMSTDRTTLSLGMFARGGAHGFLNALSERLDRYIAAGMVQLMLETTAEELIMENNEVVGVKTDKGDYKATSVILCTGGYGYNLEYLKMAGFKNVISSCPKSCTGDGFTMALKAGGVLDNMDKLVFYYPGGVPCDGFDQVVSLNTRYPGLVYVDNTGKRPCAANKISIVNWRDAPESVIYAIISGNLIDKEKELLTRGLPNKGWDRLEELAADGEYVLKADTIQGLADAMKAPGLKDTLEKYNADAQSGTDSVYGQEGIVALSEGPYYAVMTVPYVWSAVPGGVRSNGKGQIVREDGTAIEGVFMAGEILGTTNILGDVNFAGIAHGMCATWGLITADEAYERLKAK